jgi:hypothetical protein
MSGKIIGNAAKLAVSFKAELNDLTRVPFMAINWIAPPQNYRLDFTTDKMVWLPG